MVLVEKYEKKNNKKNRIVLDFLNQCFRNNDGARPVAADLLTHKFLN